MHLIVGLGNPGNKYVNTRHNIGFNIVDFLALATSSSSSAPKKGILSKLRGTNNAKFKASKFRALICEAKIGGKKIILAKPQTFMNLSGEAVGQIAKFYKIENKNIIVIYDDIDLPLGKLRLKPNGGSGGHNGIKSIIAHIGEEFNRVRIGIKGDKHADYDTADYVLAKFLTSETDALIPIAKIVTEAVEDVVRNDINSAMNKFNRG